MESLLGGLLQVWDLLQGRLVLGLSDNVALGDHTHLGESFGTSKLQKKKIQLEKQVDDKQGVKENLTDLWIMQTSFVHYTETMFPTSS